jgi:hypothetical protein
MPNKLKRSSVYFSLILFVFSFLVISQSALKDESQIKNDAILWSKGSINDATFALEIQSMAKNEMVKMSQSQQDSSLIQIPSWVKNNAVWWAEGKISDEEFHSSTQYLIDSKIMKV